MFNEPNLELVVLCVTLLIETSIRPDLTEIAFRSIIILERSIMFNEPNLELVVL